jgi:hypothetical protein
MKSINTDTISLALKKSWNLKSSSLWREDNPALGNCGVTALVVQGLLGGDILKTKYGNIWHYYNFIDGKQMDFTASQFDAPIAYDDLPSNREEAFTDTNSEQYSYLNEAVKSLLKSL